MKAPWLKYTRTPLLEQAAVERQLKHQISASLDQGGIFHNPRHPEFRCLNPHKKFGMFNPGNRYHIATIDAAGSYVVRGKRRTSAGFETQIDAADPGFNENLTSSTPVSQRWQDDLVVDKQDNFEIIISDIKTGDNWLSNIKGSFEANRILIRERFMD